MVIELNYQLRNKWEILIQFLLEIDDGEIQSQEECWGVITAFFQEKGLVRQQLDSFDRFIESRMQAIIDEDNRLEVERAGQYTGREDDITVFFISTKKKKQTWNYFFLI